MRMPETSLIQKLESLLLVAVPRDLMDTEVLELRRQVLREIRKHHSRWVLLDFSRVDIADSFFGRFIQGMAETANLMGAEVVVSGLQDAVVETMVELGMTLPNIKAVLDLDDALALSRAGDRQNDHDLDGDIDEWADTTWDLELDQVVGADDIASPGEFEGAYDLGGATVGSYPTVADGDEV